jgi:hypothetical protein
MGENHRIIFNIYLEYYIHRKHQLPNFSNTNWKEAPTPIYRLQPEGSYNSLILQLQLEGGSNPLVYRLQPEGSSNSLDSPAPTGRRLQPPSFMSTNSKEVATPLQAPTCYLKTPIFCAPPNLPEI